MRLPRIPIVLASLAATAACAANSSVAERPAAPTVAPALTAEATSSETGGAASGGNEILGTVAGLPIHPLDLLDEWHQLSPRDVWFVVDRLVTLRLAVAEAETRGIRVAPEEVEAAWSAEWAQLESDVARDRPGGTVEEFVRRELGQDPSRYRRALRQAVAEELLIERVVRGWILGQENLSLRLIVVAVGDLATIEGLLADGADFAELARVHSLDDTAEAGGLVPHLVFQEGAPLTRLAFETPPGEIGGPLRADEHELLFRVEGRRKPLPAAWSAQRDAVLASLAAAPVADSEFLHWKLAMEREYPLDLDALKERLGVVEPR